MDAELQPNGWYKIDFTITNGEYTYQDALHLTPEEYDSLSDSDVETMKQARFDKWLEVMAQMKESARLRAEKEEAESQAAMQDPQTTE